MQALYKVLVSKNNISKESVQLLQKTCSLELWDEPLLMPREELLKRIPGKDGLICMPSDAINKEVLDAAGPCLKVVATISTGYEHIDLEECKKRGIATGNASDVATDSCAELTVALLLAVSRRLIEANKQITNEGWRNNLSSKLWMRGKSLVGSTVGIVGLGRIGFGVAERLKGFKVSNIVYSGNSPKVKAKEVLNAEFVSFDELLYQSDFVIVCCSLTSTSKGLFNLQAFKKMKKNSIFINTTRGGIVNQEDLHTALTTGLIKAAGLDTMIPEPLPTDHKLTKLPNCVLLPHISSCTVETRDAVSLLTAKNIVAGLEGKPLPSPI